MSSAALDGRPPLTSAEYARQRDAQRDSVDPAALRAALAAGMDPDMRFDINHLSTPLMCAIDAKPFSPECARILLDAGADPNPKDDRGRSAIQNAMSHAHNSEEAFELAMAIATCPRLLPWPGEHLLSLAFYAPALVEHLAKAGFDPNAICPERSFPALEKSPSFQAQACCLGQAISYGTTNSAQAVKALVRVGANPNGRQGYASPLTCCILLGGTACAAEELLDCGADPLRIARGGMDALALARAALRCKRSVELAAMMSIIEYRHLILSEKKSLGSISQQAPRAGTKKL